jgi:hypothetical protein
MRSAVEGMSSSTKNAIFGSVFGFCVLLAIFPPFYLWGTRSGAPQILGMPFAVAYMLFDALLLTVAVAILYRVEDVRGELD